VLNHLNRDDNDRKQKRFRRTVFAVQDIVNKKKYKDKAVSLEAYFKDFWKISRAQVYRFLDCATVLKVHGFFYVEFFFFPQSCRFVIYLTIDFTLAIFYYSNSKALNMFHVANVSADH
jgi:uncharacterized protein (DUF433 family)